MEAETKQFIANTMHHYANIPQEKFNLDYNLSSSV